MLKGGVPYDPDTFNAGKLRAELAAVAGRYAFQHGGRIADAILERYELKPKKEKK